MESVIEVMYNYQKKDGENFMLIGDEKKAHVSCLLSYDCKMQMEVEEGKITFANIQNNRRARAGRIKRVLAYDTPTFDITVIGKKDDVPLFPNMDFAHFSGKDLVDWITNALPESHGQLGIISLTENGPPIKEVYLYNSYSEDYIENKKNAVAFITGKYKEARFRTTADGTTELKPEEIILDTSTIPGMHEMRNGLFFSRSSEEEDWIGDGINKFLTREISDGVMITPSKEKIGGYTVILTRAVDNEPPYVVKKKVHETLKEASEKFAETCGYIERKHVGGEREEFIKMATKEKTKEYFTQDTGITDTFGTQKGQRHAQKQKTGITR